MIVQYCIWICFISLIQQIKGKDILLCQHSKNKNTILDVECPVDEVIVFEWAQYGRQDTVTCSSQGGYVAKTDCTFPEALALLQKHCFKKTVCNVDIGTIFKPDPCPRTVKYLKARYSCVSEAAIIPLCDSFYIKDKKSGYIISPNYPEHYDPEKRCTAEIVHRSEKYTKLQILDMEVEARTHSSGCYDWLKLEERDNLAKHYSYCGTMDKYQEDPMDMTFENAVIKFLPDQMSEYRGFLIKFEAVTGVTKNEIAKRQNDQHHQQIENKHAKLENDNNKKDDKSTEDEIQQLQQKILKLKELKERKKKEHLEYDQKVQEAREMDACTEEYIQVPNNSIVLSYKEGLSAIIVCTYNYYMEHEDDGLLLCKNNTWVGQSGRCIPKKCPIPNSPHNGEAIYRSLSIGSNVEYVCHRGFVLYGKRSLKCLPGGHWDRFEPFCEEAGVKTISLFGEFLVACVFAFLFVSFKHRVTSYLYNKEKEGYISCNDNEKEQTYLIAFTDQEKTMFLDKEEMLLKNKSKEEQLMLRDKGKEGEHCQMFFNHINKEELLNGKGKEEPNLMFYNGKGKEVQI